MFVESYELREDPFSGTSMPRHPYVAASYSEALAGLCYGLERRLGTQLLIGERGTGKTTLLRQLQLRTPKDVRTLFLSASEGDGCFQGLFSDLGSNGAGTAVHERIRDVLLPEGAPQKRVVLLVDSADALEHSMLTAICSLANCDESDRAWLQVVLATSAAIVERLAYLDSMQFCRAVRIERLTPAEVEKYINHRIRMAGWAGATIFSADACAAIAQCSKGIPTNINQLCSRALQTAHKCDAKRIDAAIVNAAMDPDEPLSDRIGEEYREQLAAPRAASMGARVLILGLIIIVAGLGLWYERLRYTHSATRSDAHAVGASETEAIDAGEQAMIPQRSPNKQFAVPATSGLATDGRLQPLALEPIQNSGGQAASREDSAEDQPAGVRSKQVGTGGERLSAPGSAARANGEQLSLAIRVGDADMRLGEYDEAIKMFRHALALAPGNEQVARKIARARRAKVAEEEILRE
jgi:general secretion pathway protein A